MTAGINIICIDSGVKYGLKKPSAKHIDILIAVEDEFGNMI